MIFARIQLTAFNAALQDSFKKKEYVLNLAERIITQMITTTANLVYQVVSPALMETTSIVEAVISLRDM